MKLGQPCIQIKLLNPRVSKGDPVQVDQRKGVPNFLLQRSMVVVLCAAQYALYAPVKGIYHEPYGCCSPLTFGVVAGSGLAPKHHLAGVFPCYAQRLTSSEVAKVGR